MNQSILGYMPNCTLYERNQKQGSMFYVSYILPNGCRMRRAVCNNKSKAKKVAKMKELQLLTGQFDEKDLAKLNLENTTQTGIQGHESSKYTIDEALDMYFELTASRKTANTQLNDLKCINKYFDFIKQKSNKQYIDEISNLDIQQLIRHLSNQGRSESTLRNAVTLTKKVFNWLINEAKVIQIENPVPKKLSIPRTNGLVRDHLPTDQEVEAILKTANTRSKKSSSSAPIKELITFIVFTGCRLGEALHAEWSDFDLKEGEGVWTIRHKSDCPTKNGLGWSPKWGKRRKISLLPEALKVLKTMPKRKSVGFVHVRDSSRKIIDRKPYPAQFVFPKTEKHKTEQGKTKTFYSRTDSIKTSWSSLKRRSGVEKIQVKDLRTYFNHVLRSRYAFSSKEAGAYLGNSSYVNDMHYTPVSTKEMGSKLNSVSFALDF
ncbi:MAG: tyrosine-type recombinase/integrase [Deltaproteobacteria bacterium]|mgnify:FL=1|jgi:integrase|nr:tyrosine-type recombinase/integrase [Deltaproteobacteria bacterium]